MKKLISLALAVAIVSTAKLSIPVMASTNLDSIPIIAPESAECPDYEHIHEEDFLEEDNTLSAVLHLSEVHCQSSGGTIGRLLVSGRTTDTIESESRICNHEETEKNDIRCYYQKVTSYQCSECEFSVTRKGTSYWGNWICK